MVLTIAAGVLLAVVVLSVLVGLIDWLDWRTSQITEREARRRATLTMHDQWPPVERFITSREFTVALIALSCLWGLARRLR